jgi:hypothetical protein
MLRNVVCLAAVGVSLLCASASANQHLIVTSQGEKVVHTRLAPVVAHRLVPPYWGKHVYQGRRR